MTELGNRLKEARLEKGLSLDDVQSITKIQKRYLIGIEEGNYSSMPGNFYVRAFIKQYAEALALNPDEVFETFKGEIPSTHTDDLPQQLSRVKTHKTVTGGNSKIFDVLPKILIVVFIVGVASLLYVFLYNHAGKDTNESISRENEPVKYVKSKNLDTVKEKESGQKTTEKEKDPTKQVEETPVVEAPKQEIAVVESSGRKTTYSLNNTDKFVVKLVSRGNSWVSIKNGKGKSFFEGTLVKGATESTTVDLTAESEARLIVGRTVDTDIYVNDQKIDYQVPPNEKVRQDITIKYVPKTE